MGMLAARRLSRRFHLGFYGMKFYLPTPNCSSVYNLRETIPGKINKSTPRRRFREKFSISCTRKHYGLINVLSRRSKKIRAETRSKRVWNFRREKKIRGICRGICSLLAFSEGRGSKLVSLDMHNYQFEPRCLPCFPSNVSENSPLTHSPRSSQAWHNETNWELKMSIKIFWFEVWKD